MPCNLKNKLLQEFSERYALGAIDKGLLRQAFTHSSAAKKNNERLEFLGDAILGSVIAAELFQQLPNAQEHYLTRLRAHLVNKTALSELANALQLSELLILGQGERQTGGKQRDSILADSLEAVIGAIFVAQGYAKARKFVVEIYTSKLASLPAEDELKDPKTRLQEWLQQRGHPVPEYKIIAEVGKPHNKTFTVEACVRFKDKNKQKQELSLQAQGRSRRIAEQQVAEELLVRLLAAN